MGSNGGLFGKLEGVTWLLDVDEDMVHSGSALEIWLGGLQHAIYLLIYDMIYMIFYFIFFARKENYQIHENASICGPRIPERPTQIGIWFRSNITIGDSREVFRALGLALWIFGAAGKESIIARIKRDRQNQVLGNIMIHGCHWIWTCVFRIRSSEHDVLRVCFHLQPACLLPKQVIGDSIFTPSLLPPSLLSRAPFLSTLSWHEQQNNWISYPYLTPEYLMIPGPYGWYIINDRQH